MVLFPLINLSLSQGKSMCVLWLVAGTKAPCRRGSAPSHVPGIVGLPLEGCERRCCVRQDAKKALKPLPVPQGILSCRRSPYSLYSAVFLYSSLFPTAGDERERWTLGLIQHNNFHQGCSCKLQLHSFLLTAAKGKGSGMWSC